jgi:PAS domain S-box-containing protein
LGAELKAAEGAPQARAKALSEVFERAPYPMALVSGPQHRYELANSAYLRLIDDRDVLGKPVAEAVPELVEQGLLAPLDAVYGTGEARTDRGVGVRLRRADGTFAHRVVDIRYEPSRDDDGRVAGVLVFVNDVTEPVRFEAALRSSERRYRSLRRDSEQALQSSEALLDAIFASAPLGLAFLDKELRYRRINQWLADINGLPADAHLGMRPDELLPGVEGLRTILDGWRKVVDTGKPWLGVEVRGETAARPGVLRTFEENFYPVRVGGETVGLGAIVEEVTDRRKAEEKIRASEARLRSLIDTAPIGVAISEPDGHVALANDALLAMLGWTRADLVNEPLDWHGFTPPEQLHRDFEFMAALRRGESPPPFEKELIRRDGERISALIMARFLPGEGETMVAFAVDITERKRAEAALRESTERLREADRRKDDFLATLAHELRNPLAPIRNGLEILKLSVPQSQGVHRTMEMMQRQMSHIVRLVDDLLDVSRITRGKVTLRRDRVRLAGVVANAVEASQAALDAKRIALDVRVADAGIVVDGDVDRLTQVFANLLSNAVKYTAPEGRVAVALRQVGSTAVVEVEDSGVGIPPEALDDVFEMFAQVPRHGEIGLGIGLFLVRQIVTMHGGEVHAASAGSGRGSRFTVTLPLAAASGGAAPADAKPGAAASAARPLRVLVVDDNRDAAESLAQLLALQGHELATGGSGRDAVALAETFKPDVIFLDLGMPEMDGIEAARRIRALPNGGAIRLVALTGFGQPADRASTSQAGFDAHLVKPARPEDLERLLTEVARTRR